MEILLSTVLVVCTSTYTIINYFMLRESAIQRKLKSRPNIIAYLKSTEDYQALRLYIKNVGEGIAKNIKVNVLKDYGRFGKENHRLSEIGVFKYGLEILSPGEHLSYYLDAWTNIKEEELENMYIELKICCTGIDNKEQNGSFNLKFIQVCSQGYTNPPETHIGKIAYYTKEINQALKKLKVHS